MSKKSSDNNVNSGEMIFRSFKFDVKKDQEDENLYWFHGSDDSIDRDDDVVRPEGWVVEHYKSNPIVLYMHNRSIPIGETMKLERSANGWDFGIRFASEGVSEKADEIRRLVEDNILKAASIGFIPLEYGWLEGGDVFEYKKIELLEISIVTVQSNRNALRFQKSIEFENEIKSKTKQNEKVNINNKKNKIRKDFEIFDLEMKQ